MAFRNTSTAAAFPQLSETMLAEAQAWFETHEAEFPRAVADTFRLTFALAKRMGDANHRQRGLLMQLRRALGILPSTEKRKPSGKPTAGTPRDPAAKLRDKIDQLRYQREHAERLGQWHAGHQRRYRRKLKALDKQLMKLEDIELTPDEEAESIAAGALLAKNLQEGERCDLVCAQSAETLMTGGGALLYHDTVDCTVDRLALPRDAEVTQKFYEERSRLNFALSVTDLTLRVEKLAVRTSRGTQLISASVDHVGPPKMNVTWEFLANMAILTSSYALPLNRFAGLVSTSSKVFTAGEASRYYAYTAKRFAPIYIALGRSLADAEVLSGDDTTSRVLDVERALASGDPEFPWAAFSTPEKARHAVALAGPAASLSAQLAATFGFEFARKDGGGAKSQFHTTVLWGRPQSHQPRSTVVFYRSHLGGLGNLLDVVLSHRRADLTQLVVQSDLSTVNLISDPAIQQRLTLLLAGCAAHARRPFALHEKDDPDLCGWLLHEFKGVFLFERFLDDEGRNAANTLAVRRDNIRPLWQTIKEVCAIVTQRWSAKTPLGEGARYVLRHYDKLTYYLGDLRVMASNNFSERLLRAEKLIENNALFRQTLDGRAALDIMRTVLQTAVAANVELLPYLTWVMRMPHEAVVAEPDAFTPLAYAKHIACESAAEDAEDFVA